MIKKLLIILFLVTTCDATLIFDRDIYKIGDKKYHRSIMDLFLLPGTADGQLLYWDATTSAWLASDVTKLKWDDVADILLAQELIVKDKIRFTQVDGNEYIDSLADGYLDAEATTGIRLRINGTEQLNLVDGVLAPTTDNDIQLGDATHRIKKGYFVDIRDTWLSPNKLIKASASADLRSADLDDFIAGTANRVIVADDGDGTVTLSTPQDIAITSSPTFAGITIDGETILGDGGTTHYTEFNTRGAMTMHGDARVTKHMVIGAGSWKRGATQPTETYENLFPTLSFQDTQDDVVHYATHVPYRWDDTTDMTVEIHWQHENVNAGKVKWHLSYIGAKEGEDPAGGGTAITQLSAGTHDPDKLIYTEFGTKMLAANLERMDDLGLMLWREGTDAGDDTLTEDAELIAVHIHYTMNQLGESGLLPVTDVLLLDDGASKLLLDDGASFMLIRL